MANTYTQIHLQFVFAVKHRTSLISPIWKKELYLYISGIVENNGHKLLAINGMPDHIHIFIGMRPTQSVSDLLQDIKRNSSLWINQKGFIRGKFEWQEGYGAFSYSKSHVENVINYIHKQEEHHKKQSFREEYLEFLKKFDIDYNEKYIFREPQ
ncbi:IS200/IS605 family transposase [Flavobacterium rakeshii]|uniref:IS200/IS605 family transposase n=1 Tax=Flavobacterium rakeshii TaxID=1038845 RepID=A0A6N8HE62_9FLAO|nr:IS200/IS605 family transposase [Flavobacterium rakeshii]MUV03017.1 IS200/IS605 family transposase [Flavobacterium rakeshii]